MKNLDVRLLVGDVDFLTPNYIAEIELNVISKEDDVIGGFHKQYENVERIGSIKLSKTDKVLYNKFHKVNSFFNLTLMVFDVDGGIKKYLLKVNYKNKYELNILNYTILS